MLGIMANMGSGWATVNSCLVALPSLNSICLDTFANLNWKLWKLWKRLKFLEFPVDFI
jgi:hypothetical protein